jgi:hypothetical protein
VSPNIEARPPTTASCSRTTHGMPKFESSYAAVSPAGPAPRITTLQRFSPTCDFTSAPHAPIMHVAQAGHFRDVRTEGIGAAPGFCHYYVKKRSSDLFTRAARQSISRWVISCLFQLTGIYPKLGRFSFTFQLSHPGAQCPAKSIPGAMNGPANSELCRKGLKAVVY